MQKLHPLPSALELGLQKPQPSQKSAMFPVLPLPSICLGFLLPGVHPGFSPGEAQPGLVAPVTGQGGSIPSLGSSFPGNEELG